MSDQPGAFSLGRTLAIAVPLVLIALGVQNYVSSGYEKAAREEIESNMLARLLGPTAAGPEASIEFVDADGDLVADAPADDQAARPESLTFTYIASSEPGEVAADWRDVVSALSDKLGVPVEYKQYGTTGEQLTALASGELHIAGFNTGAVPLAVKTSGFVPVCTFGRADGEFGYTMRIIAPAKSPIEGPAALKGKKVTFVRPDSNSGCKAALVLLMDKYDLLPERDYDWGFSMGHDTSILGVASGDFQAAPVASDIFDRMAEAGEVDSAAVSTVYESERFPPAALGYAHNLAPEIKAAITEALMAFEWAGTSIEGKVGGAEAVKFVPVDYKNDWANTRRIDEAVQKAREK